MQLWRWSLPPATLFATAAFGSPLPLSVDRPYSERRLRVAVIGTGLRIRVALLLDHWRGKLLPLFLPGLSHLHFSVLRGSRMITVSVLHYGALVKRLS